VLSVLSVYLSLAGLLVTPFAVLSAAPAYANTPNAGASLWTDYFSTMLNSNPATHVMMLRVSAWYWTSVFTVDPSADLQETYLPDLAAGWTTQDLSATYGTPPS